MPEITILEGTNTPIRLLQSKINPILDQPVTEGIKTARTVSNVIADVTSHDITLRESAAKNGVIVIGGDNPKGEQEKERADLLGELGYIPANER